MEDLSGIGQSLLPLSLLQTDEPQNSAAAETDNSMLGFDKSSFFLSCNTTEKDLEGRERERKRRDGEGEKTWLVTIHEVAPLECLARLLRRWLTQAFGRFKKVGILVPRL